MKLVLLAGSRLPSVTGVAMLWRRPPFGLTRWQLVLAAVAINAVSLALIVMVMRRVAP